MSEQPQQQQQFPKLALDKDTLLKLLGTRITPLHQVAMNTNQFDIMLGISLAVNALFELDDDLKAMSFLNIRDVNRMKNHASQIGQTNMMEMVGLNVQELHRLKDAMEKLDADNQAKTAAAIKAATVAAN